MSEHDDGLYIQDMREAVTKIEQYVGNQTQ